MFDKLVVSAAQRRRGRTSKFFLGTSIIYLSAVAVAFALSILLATPKLADTASLGPGPITFPVAGLREKPHDDGKPNIAPTKDPRNVESLEDIIANLGVSRRPVVNNSLPPGPTTVGDLDTPVGGGSDMPGIPTSTGRDVGSRNVISDPPKPPDPPKPQPRPVDTRKPVPLSSTVLQGKAIARVVPVYPELPKRIGLQGDVSVEVIISPEGRVESARIVSGHLMLVSSALEAARRWRFEPTFLNNVPVRVTGVITFVFKLNE